ncbi:MAG: zinc-ribbon domain-containing protein [Candidatus Hodarchaeota archaeon]
MTTTNPTGYCPHCQQVVLLTREDIDICLAIILLIFTAGIGLIIYLAIYYSREEDKCVHCGTRIIALQTQPAGQISYQQQAVEEFKRDNPFYCTYCGEKLIVEGIKFCPKCGSKIGEP